MQMVRVPEILTPRVPEILAVLSRPLRVAHSLYLTAGEGMIDMLKRHEIQVLRRAGHAQLEVAKLAGVSLGSVRRVEREPEVPQIDRGRAPERRAIGRPAKAEPFRAVVVDL